MGTIFGRSVLGESAPSAAYVEEFLTGLETDLFANDTELVILELFEGLFAVDVGYYARGVYHARAEKPAVEVITAVIVVTDLLLVYNSLALLNMREDLTNLVTVCA
jgi:hypothetical protein